MGQIATMLTSVKRTRSPLQKELDSLTKVLGIIAWTAVAFIVVVGLAPRAAGSTSSCCSARRWRSRRSRPGMPAFVSGLLSLGAKQLADAKAVVKNLTDVETLGATSAINTDKTGTLTMNQMMVSTHLRERLVVQRRGRGLPQDRRDHVGVAGDAGARLHPPRARARLDSDATVGDDGAVVGDPTEAALVVLAAKLGRRRRGDPPRLPAPRRGAVRLRLQVHGDLPPRPRRRRERVIELVKGGPDVVLARCCDVGRPAERLAGPDRARPASDIDAANARMGEKGLRVLAFAARFVDDERAPGDARATRCRSTSDLAFVGMVGIIDPLRAEAKAAVHTALGAGIDVRMITGDHAVTAQAIGEQLGLGPGAISGDELQALSDDELARRAPRAARVRPRDARGQAPARAARCRSRA